MSVDGPDLPDRPGRRPRYAGKYPRKFEEKYKERDPGRYRETVAKVLASGKTPAGTHRPIMVREILEVLAPIPGARVVDCTLGYGGHARELLARIQPGGKLLGLDADPIELSRTEQRLRAAGYGLETFVAVRTNFAGIRKALTSCGWADVDAILADLGVSSMQLDDPARGFSMKHEGPLDMRLNPSRGMSAAELLSKLTPEQMTHLLVENADEPQAARLGPALAGKAFATTGSLAEAVRATLRYLRKEEIEPSVRRVFQAIRIAVNDEFAALENLLRELPDCLAPGGRAAILTFHSGEDRRVKHAFEAGVRAGAYSRISPEVIRPDPAEQRDNPRSTPAKLRWAQKAGPAPILSLVKKNASMGEKCLAITSPVW